MVNIIYYEEYSIISGQATLMVTDELHVMWVFLLTQFSRVVTQFLHCPPINATSHAKFIIFFP